MTATKDSKGRSPIQSALSRRSTESGLRGRGGAGFPTGIKWKTVAEAKADQKYIVCNADEGDSGTFADRMIMEGDPFVLIEGMTIAGIVVGATKVEKTQSEADRPLTALSIPARLKRTGKEMRIIVEDGSEPGTPDTGLVRLLVRARAIRDQLLADRSLTFEDIANRRASFRPMRRGCSVSPYWRLTSPARFSVADIRRN